MSKFDIENLPTSETGKRMLKRVAPIYQNSYIAKWLYQVMGEEWDGAWDIALSLRDQIFTETVTWGIEYQEHKYSIVPDESLSLDERRARLKRRTQQKFPLNPGVLEQFIKNGWSITADVDETVDYGRLKLTFPNDLPSTVEEMLKEVRRIKPSHLVLFLKLIRELHLDDDESKIRLGIVSAFEGYRHIGIASPEDFICKLNTSIIPAQSGIVRISVGLPEASDPLSFDVGLGAFINGKRGMGVNAEDLPEIFREESSWLAPIIGIAQARRGVKILPLAMPETSVLPFGYGTSVNKAGKRIYGLAPSTNGIIVPVFGTATAHNGTRETVVDLNDLPKWFNDQPIIAEVVRTTDFKTGRNLIGLTKPERERISLATGFLHGLFGVTSLAVAEEDLPSEFTERTAKLAATFGMSLKQQTRRKISLALPETAKAAFGAGLLQKWSGTRTVPLAPPEEAMAEEGVGIATAESGKRSLSADSADIPDWYKGSLDSAQAALFLGTAQVIQGKKKAYLSPPEDVTEVLSVGNAVEQSGVKEVAVNPSDIPQSHKSVLDNAEIAAHIGIKLTKRGKKAAGLAPVAEPEATPANFGIATKTTGTAAIRADPADLPEEYSAATPQMGLFVGVSLLKDIRRQIHLTAPEKSTTTFTVAVAETQGGKRNISLAAPDNAEIQAKVGLSNINGGARNIDADQTDLPEMFKNILDDAVTTAFAGCQSNKNGVRKISVTPVPNGDLSFSIGSTELIGGRREFSFTADDLPETYIDNSAHIAPFIGFNVQQKGVRRTGLTAIVRETTGFFADAVGAITGYKVIGADLNDLEPPRPRRGILPHVGLVHVGAMAAV